MGRSGIQPLPPRPRVARQLRLRAVQQRMPHEARVHPALAQEILLERQHHRHLVRVAAQVAHPRLVPRPHLRRDVVEDGDAGRLRVPRQAQVEAGIVDGDDEVHALRLQRGEDPLAELDEERQVLDHLHEPHHRQLVQPGERLHPLRPHPPAAEADEPRGGKPLAQRPGERRPVQVAALLARRDEDRGSPRPERGGGRIWIDGSRPGHEFTAGGRERDVDPRLPRIVILRERPREAGWCTIRWARPKDLARRSRNPAPVHTLARDGGVRAGGQCAVVAAISIAPAHAGHGHAAPH